MVEENFSKACNETLQVLKNIDTIEYNKIPKDFIDNLKENADNKYVCKIDFNKNFNEQDLLPETIDLLAYIYRKFWCSEQEKIIFDKAMYQNEKKYQEELKEKYKYDKIFDRNESIKQTKKDDLMIIPVEHKENIFKKLINFLKNKFKKN